MGWVGNEEFDISWEASPPALSPVIVLIHHGVFH